MFCFGTEEAEFFLVCVCYREGESRGGSHEQEITATFVRDRPMRRRAESSKLCL